MIFFNEKLAHITYTEQQELHFVHSILLDILNFLNLLVVIGTKCTTETTILVSVQYRNPNWLILSADTVTNTETTFQRENLVTNSMGYFFNHKRAP